MQKILIIGGGFFGMYIAEFYALNGYSVTLCEQDSELMRHASYVNQARVHNGYHYPRSVLTALRSRVSFPRFIKEFENCIDDTFDKYYMIGKILGKVTAKQFQLFCDRIGAYCEPVSNNISRMVDSNYIETVFSTVEYAFNSTCLKETMLARLNNAGVDIQLDTEVRSVSSAGGGLAVEIREAGSGINRVIEVEQAFNCTYSMLNSINHRSRIEFIPLKHEMTEICLVEVPEELKEVGITVMCGPYFSIMPFPPRGVHSFSHVRYTPHYEWTDTDQEDYINSYNRLKTNAEKSSWRYMLQDAKRYMPVLSECVYKESLWEVKTVLPRSESDDSRPILFRRDHGIKGYHCILGGKIDNVYDVTEVIKENKLV